MVWDNQYNTSLYRFFKIKKKKEKEKKVDKNYGMVLITEASSDISLLQYFLYELRQDICTAPCIIIYTFGTHSVFTLVVFGSGLV